MTGLTPTTRDVRASYVETWRRNTETPQQHYMGGPVPDHGVEFDRWLEAHDQEVRDTVSHEACNPFQGYELTHEWLGLHHPARPGGLSFTSEERANEWISENYLRWPTIYLVHRVKLRGPDYLPHHGDPKPWLEYETGSRFTQEEMARLSDQGRQWRGLGYSPRTAEQREAEEAG